MDEGTVGASRILIVLDGEEVDAAETKLLSADVLLARRCVGAFSLVFADSRVVDRIARARSVALAVPPDHRHPLIVGDVSATRHERETVGGSAVVLRGFDAGGRLAEGKRTRTWIGLDAFGVADALAREHGLELDRGDSVRSSDLTVPTLQRDESDWSFLRRLAERADVELQVEGRRLRFGRGERETSGARSVPSMVWGVESSLQSVQSDGRTAELVVRGVTSLRPSNHLKLQGCGPVDGMYRVEEIRFLLDGAGWTSLIVAERRPG